MFSIIALVLLWVVNLLISYWNARVTGLAWVESKQVGGWERFMTWMAAIMSASGFTWCYMIVLLLGAYFLQFNIIVPDIDGVVHPFITMKHLQGGFSLGYLIIIPGVLFSGLMIWIDSLLQAWRRRDLPSMGVAAWNTFAQVHNTYSAMRGIPDAISGVADAFAGGDSDDNNGKAMVIVVLLVVISVAAGILTTAGIIKKYAGSRMLEDRPVQSSKRLSRSYS